MNLSREIAVHLPYLRRFARALCGSQVKFSFLQVMLAFCEKAKHSEDACKESQNEEWKK